MADDALPTTPVTKPKDRWKNRENPDWVSGWKDDEKKDLDEYCAMLRADPRARTPGRTEDGGVKLQKGTTMAVPRRGGSGRFIEARQSDTTLLTIAKGANHCDAGQVFKNLLLSEKARAESIPELEVLADEVAAAHGAASAPVNPDQLHYLMSRGLDEETAVALLIEGFMHDGFSTLENQALVDEMRTRLTVHLECELKR